MLWVSRMRLNSDLTGSCASRAMIAQAVAERQAGFDAAARLRQRHLENSLMNFFSRRAIRNRKNHLGKPIPPTTTIPTATNNGAPAIEPNIKKHNPANDAEDVEFLRRPTQAGALKTQPQWRRVLALCLEFLLFLQLLLACPGPISGAVRLRLRQLSPPGWKNSTPPFVFRLLPLKRSTDRASRKGCRRR